MSQRKAFSQSSIPFWRDIRILRVISQIVFLFLFGLLMYWFGNNMMTNLEEQGSNINFRFLGTEANFPISEGIEYDYTKDSNAYAFIVGIVNTLRVIIIGIVLATILGAIIGISRLSSNWLIRKLASAYIETLRNIPLLVQLVFWYLAVILTALPLVREAIALPGGIFIHKRGLNIPWAVPTESIEIWLGFLVAGLIAAITIYIVRRNHLLRLDRPGFPLAWAFLGFVGIAIVGWITTTIIQSGVAPMSIDYPVFERANFKGGMGFSSSFFALLMGLVLYTAAFIAEIVRAGIQSVNKGQSEAAISAGLKKIQVLRLVVIPQALRVIIPPLTSQYLNLTKNSSLAILIGYYDLLNVGTTIFNQTGRVPEIILMIAIAYLTMSLITSVFMNIYNRKMKLMER